MAEDIILSAQQNIPISVIYKHQQSWKRRKSKMPRGGSKAAQIDRSELERNRRLYMKSLLSGLAFLLPNPPSKASSGVLLEQAVAHIKQLQEGIEALKQRKQLLQATSTAEIAGMSGGSRVSLDQVVSVLVEEAAEVVAISYSGVADSFFCAIYFQAVSPRIGIEISRVQERLKELIL